MPFIFILEVARPGAIAPQPRAPGVSPHFLSNAPPPPEPPKLQSPALPMHVPSLGALWGHLPAQPSGWPSLGLNKKTTSHNTHKILMCLQNYLIFYLEVIPPLSSFIALYTTEVGEPHQMRPSRLPSRVGVRVGGGVFTA